MLADGDDEVVCEIDGREYRQAPFGYQGKCLMWMREASAALADADRVRVDAMLTNLATAMIRTIRVRRRGQRAREARVPQLRRQALHVDDEPTEGRVRPGGCNI